MENITQHLLQLANQLDTDGKQVCANAVDGIIKEASLEKLAQYVGVIGYVLKQNRAMANCIRKKRVANEGPMQETVMQCLKEYQDGQDYHDTDWTSKYAQVVQTRPELFDKAHIDYLSQYGQKQNISDHLARVEQVSTLLKENNTSDPLVNMVLAHMDNLGEVLQKEIGLYSPLPFKVAAPASPRSWWQRFTNPSKGKWWNPMSWSDKRRERGRTEESKIDNQNRVDQLGQLLGQNTDSINGLKGDISQLKRKLEFQIPRIRHAGIQKKVQSLSDQIRNDDWSATSRAIEDLSKMKASNYFAWDPEDQTFEKINQTISTIDNNMTNINGLVSELRQSNTSPSVDQFARVIRALNTNRLDQESYDIAMQHFHLLRNKLTGEPLENTTQTGPGSAPAVTPEGKAAVQRNYLEWKAKGGTFETYADAIRESLAEEGTKKTKPEIAQLLRDSYGIETTNLPFPSTIPNKKTEAPGKETEGIDEDPNFSWTREKVDKWIKYLVDQNTLHGTPIQQYSQLYTLLFEMKSGGILGKDADGLLKYMFEKLKELGGKGDYEDGGESPPTGTPPTGTPPTGTPPMGTPPTGTPPMGTPPMGTPPTGTPVEPSSSGVSLPTTVPGAPADTAVKPERVFRPRKKTTRPKKRRATTGYGTGFDAAGQMAEDWRQMDKNKSMTRAETLRCLVKIADVFDEFDPNLASMIDLYIQEHTNEELPEFPELAKLVKEKEGLHE